MMENPLRTDADYELFIYSLADRYASIERSTLTFVRRGHTFARVAGELYFAGGYRIVVRERIVFDRLPAEIDWYGYEVWHGDTKLYWYDPQPHPNEPSLQSTHPHHKHVPPNMKHNRVPAPQMSFQRPNLPVVIAEVETLIRSQNLTGE
ncbi:DUF6516 family protein [Litorilinea aerophila]|uniref:Uncharacterized protein n=1 Tax=Litorilinea aerophila TaxID=1204385 RepID=A0A540VF36_9CHLR|nr:DUF6516 family protein [Litorilinea aerophila]MCC9076889.1 DUF6516 family protein [Litorilinea aerophila]